jgi:hypothetical protein
VLSFLFALVLISGIAGFVAYSLRRDKPLASHSQGHWHQSIEGLKGTTRDFYEAVEATIREQNLPDVNIAVVAFQEAGVFSDRRDYLRIRRGEHLFDLCVAPFGNSFFVSSWFCERPRIFLDFLSSVPFFGWLARGWARLFLPVTYYKVDSALLFQSAVHECVLHVLDRMIADQGLEPLVDSARKPVMREVYDQRRKLALA